MQVALDLGTEARGADEPHATQEYTVLHLFCGIGGGALGFQAARTDWRGIRGQYRTLGGIDNDADACADFEALTGTPATCMDLFSRDDYLAFHGAPPRNDWREATPEDIRAASGGVAPDVVFTSPPCKGFSGLLPNASAKTEKYQALNRLTVRGLSLVLEAWADNPPGLIILENVPRITSRGAHLLAQIKALLITHGYAVSDDTHDVGETGGLAQHRRRYLLVARHRVKMPAFLYRPRKRPVRAIGDVLERLPMPDDPSMGPMHRLPRLAWRTWVRLALIPAGGDWRDLQGIQGGDYLIQPHMGDGTHPGKYAVEDWRAPARTVTGSRMGSGAQAVADPRVPSKDGRHASHMHVGAWEEPAGTVTGATHVANGLASVADPRVHRDPMTFHGSPGLLGVIPWGAPSGAITGSASASSSNAPAAVQDPRLTCKPMSGAYRILRWDEASTTVTASGDIHSQGAAAIADPRMPADTDNGAWVIVALDGTWHRPLTTLELAALQGLPVRMRDGSPLVLAGRSHSRWRERIGNAVPPPAAQAIGEMMLYALMPSRARMTILSPLLTALWVAWRRMRKTGRG